MKGKKPCGFRQLVDQLTRKKGLDSRQIFYFPSMGMGQEQKTVIKMKMVSVEDFRIVSSFQTVSSQLKEGKYADRMEKPLAFWALPNDRRLPLALLGRSIKELIDTPFEEIAATPGIGQKKIGSLVKLLNRATKDHPPGVTYH